MKRALTGFAAAAVVLGMASPLAFADTSSSTALTSVGQVAFSFNGSTVSNPYIMDGQDSGNTTAFAPIYYFDQLLAKAGITATWNGATHTWALTDSSLDAATVAANIAGGVGTGNTTITLNGTVIKKINTQVAKDPAGGAKAQATTYFPVYYVQTLFAAIGINTSWNGATGLSVSSSAATAKLANLVFSGASMGSGTQSSPAVGVNGTPVTASTTLTDANGNPVAGINVTFDIVGSSLPVVTSNGVAQTVSGSGTAMSPYTVSVATNAAGIASITISSSNAVSYTVQAVAPYSQNGISVTSNTGYVEFGQPGNLLLTPVGSVSEAFSTSSNSAGLVPVTATVIPTASGVSVANIPVQFSVTGSNAYLATSSGSYLQPLGDQTVYTNANGQATIYVNATQQANVTVSASATVNGVQETSATTNINWQASGTPASISNTPTGTIAAATGTNVTISGTVEDSLGNPVPNAQILVSGYDKGNGDLDYVAGGTSTAFPNVGNGSLSGADAASAFGDLITTDANGNFSLTVSDSSAETGNLYVYAVQNGQLGSQIGQYTINFTSTTSGLSASYVDTTASGLGTTSANDEYTKLTGLNYQEGGSTTQAPIYVGAFSGSTPFTSGVVQYTVTSNNKGYVAAVDGVALNGTNALPNDPSSAIIDVTYSAGAVSNVTVDGTSITKLTGYSAPTAGTFTFVPGDNNVENDTFTVTTGSLSDTVGANFVAGAPSEISNAGSFTVSPGQSQTISFTVEDSNGNPVPYGAVSLASDLNTNNLWITAVNGQQLAQTVYSGGTSYGTQPTPIPLFTFSPANSGSLESSIYLSGAVSATGVGTNSQNVTVYANQSGQVSITFTAGGNGYWDATSSNPGVVGSPIASSGSVAYFSYGSNGTINVSSTAPASDGIGSLTY
ncbi:hypothetical protein SAMN04489725_11954 [Alicyclobacillus hesperidum]|uniref:Big-1 domain-containing protein n=1 Tax=Alicyclobacillus hesperidum TaxID=89784 RepID=A0A1H2XCS0_9BACL|nr:Ig-like domain-containing protein [Alicyclobacillus hesperidum]SDW90244.1 hypothetical protein SAMN04489725_11954 [Alicyclobacillus hesperidum]